VCLHGYGQSKGASLRFGRSIRRDWPVAALQAPHPHHVRAEGGLEAGFSWVSSFEPGEDIENHHRFILHVLGRAFQEGLTDAPRGFLFGFSQSVSLNYRFALAHPESVRGVVAVAGATPSDWPPPGAGPRLEVPVLHVAPTEDEAYSGERVRGFRAQLEARVQDLTFLEVPGRHRVPSAAYPMIREWLDALFLSQRD